MVWPGVLHPHREVTQGLYPTKQGGDTRAVPELLLLWGELSRALELISPPPSRKCFTKAKPWKFPDVPHEENEDEDVKAERLRVKEILSSPRSEEVKP